MTAARTSALVATALALMLASGAAWGVHSLLGRGVVAPVHATTRAFAGALWMGEPPSVRLVGASAAILGAIALVLRRASRSDGSCPSPARSR